MTDRELAKLKCDHMRSVMADPDLSAHAKLTYWAMVDHAGKTAVPKAGVRTLATETASNVKTICGALKALAKKELLTIERSWGHPSKYMLPKWPTRDSVPSGQALSEAERSAVGDGTPALSQTERSAFPDGTKRRPNETQNETQNEKGAKLDPWKLACEAMTTDALRSETFGQAWVRWTAYHQERRKPLTASTIRAQVKKLEGFGHDDAIQSIERSIENGWTGLFPPKGDGSGKGNGRHVGGRIAAPAGKHEDRMQKARARWDSAAEGTGATDQAGA